MPLFAKVDPMGSHFDVGAFSTVKMKLRSSVPLIRGDEVILWGAETAGGIGLCAVGIVESIAIRPFPNARTSGQHEEFVLTLLVTAANPDSLTKEDLRQYRDDGSGSPLAELSRQAYRFAHCRSTLISEEAARYLRARFLDAASGRLA